MIFFPRSGCKFAEKNHRQMYGTKNRDWTLSSTATSIKFGQCNPLSSIFNLLLINCSEFNFWENYWPSHSHTNTVISASVAYPSRWLPKPSASSLIYQRARSLLKIFITYMLNLIRETFALFPKILCCEKRKSLIFWKKYYTLKNVSSNITLPKSWNEVSRKFHAK